MSLIKQETADERERRRASSLIKLKWIKESENVYHLCREDDTLMMPNDPGWMPVGRIERGHESYLGRQWYAVTDWFSECDMRTKTMGFFFEYDEDKGESLQLAKDWLENQYNEYLNVIVRAFDMVVRFLQMAAGVLSCCNNIN